MLTKLKNAFNLARNMGPRYIIFRTGYELKMRAGLLKAAYPTTYQEKQFITLENWKKAEQQFFFESKETIAAFPLAEIDKPILKEEYDNYTQGRIKFFNAFYLDLGKNYDWVTNPDTGKAFDIKKHWTEIKDLDPVLGDIKYVWEKSRFSFLYTLIRYDKHFGVDCANQVFAEIIDWIDKNPLNSGPNYKCSQETSLRILNWTFALHYYKNAPQLTEAIFQKITNSIYWQTKHVEANINFSRIAVRNNHAITETLCLYLIGLLYPAFPDSTKWKNMGKAYFEEEVLYQIYEDGSYLQFSMNYHRVVVQLLTWALVLAEKNKETFNPQVYSRAQMSAKLLYKHQDLKTGQLPNYGANDGALFFKLSSNSYRDYKPQLNALYYALNKSCRYEAGNWDEDLVWYGAEGIEALPRTFDTCNCDEPVNRFEKGGFYVLRDENAFAFIRCGSYKDRPSQADNLHLDIWADGVNILRDSGSYKYNSTPDDIRYFMGTASHNTLMLGNYDQMQKGGRFIWYKWSSAVKAKALQDIAELTFEGKIHAYKHVAPSIFHTRKVTHYTEAYRWLVEDSLDSGNSEMVKVLPKKQIWNLHPDFEKLGFTIKVWDAEGKELFPEKQQTWYSGFYGQKEQSEQWVFETFGDKIKTEIGRK